MERTEKLVRDKMPEIVRAKGEEYNYRIAGSDKEFAGFLKAKLLEEIDEFFDAAPLSADKVSEMADIMETLGKIGEFYGVDRNEVERVRKEKLALRGGFEQRIIWDGKGYVK